MPQEPPTEFEDVGRKRRTLMPLVLNACICTKLMYVEPPVLATLIAATGAQVGDAERDDDGFCDVLVEAEGERDTREPLAERERERECDAELAAITFRDGVLDCDERAVADALLVVERLREAEADVDCDGDGGLLAVVLRDADRDREDDGDGERVRCAVRVTERDAVALRDADREPLAVLDALRNGEPVREAEALCEGLREHDADDEVLGETDAEVAMVRVRLCVRLGVADRDVAMVRVRLRVRLGVEETDCEDDIDGGSPRQTVRTAKFWKSATNSVPGRLLTTAALCVIRKLACVPRPSAKPRSPIPPPLPASVLTAAVARSTARTRFSPVTKSVLPLASTTRPRGVAPLGVPNTAAVPTALMAGPGPPPASVATVADAMSIRRMRATD
jgi:hypothetical protein